MAKSMNPDLADAVEKLGEIGGMSESEAQTYLASNAAALVEKAQERARKTLNMGKAPRRFRGNRKARKAAVTA